MAGRADAHKCTFTFPEIRPLDMEGQGRGIKTSATTSPHGNISVDSIEAFQIWRGIPKSLAN